MARWPREDDEHDYDGHGTAVASVAAGKTCGVASNADLVLVKMCQTPFVSRDPNDTRREPMDTRALSTGALREAWTWVVDDVLTKRRNSQKKGHAIVCMAIGV